MTRYHNFLRPRKLSRRQADTKGSRIGFSVVQILTNNIQGVAAKKVGKQARPPTCNWMQPNKRTSVCLWKSGAIFWHEQRRGEWVARNWLIRVNRFQLWGTCQKQAFDGNSGRPSEPVLEPQQNIHFLLWDGDDARAVDCSQKM